ncbi:MAG: class I SAM-dependent methyltransferase [Spirochaetes bacterium]|nr:class I SAM-dependent methyltransferase [Spirochaetota bacterium]
MQKHEHKGKSSSAYINAEEVIAKLPLVNGMHILDAGCGDGYFSVALSKQFPDSTIYALDYNEESITTLSDFARDNNYNNLKPVVGDITKDIPFKTDAIIMVNVLHGLVYNHEIDITMHNIVKSLQKDGFLVIIDFYKREGIPGPSMDVKLSVDQTTATLYQCGFKIINIFPAGQYHYAVVAKMK